MTRPERGPLVERNEDGIPRLRGTGLSPSDLQAYEDAGYTATNLRHRWSSLADWPVADIETAMTYPRVAMEIKTTNYTVTVDGIGSIVIDGWFDPSSIPAVIAALQQAQEIVAAWTVACSEWEAMNP